jgi:hypothetical protein
MVQVFLVYVLYLLHCSLQRVASTQYLCMAVCFATRGSGEWQEPATRLLHLNSTLFRLHPWPGLHPIIAQ